MRAVEKIARTSGLEPPANLRATTLGADLAANAIYYSAAATTGGNNAILTGTALGLAAGVGGILLPGPMGLGSGEVNRTRSTQVMVVGMYTVAGLIAGLTYKLISQRA